MSVNTHTHTHAVTTAVSALQMKNREYVDLSPDRQSNTVLDVIMQLIQ